MDIKKYFENRTQKEQSDKSSGEESDTEESLCRADKSKTFRPAPSLINICTTEEEMLQEKAKLQETLGGSLSLGSV